MRYGSFAVFAAQDDGEGVASGVALFEEALYHGVRAAEAVVALSS